MNKGNKPIASKTMRRRQRDLLKAICILLIVAIAIGTWPKRNASNIEVTHGHGKNQ